MAHIYESEWPYSIGVFLGGGGTRENLNALLVVGSFHHVNYGEETSRAGELELRCS